MEDVTTDFARCLAHEFHFLKGMFELINLSYAWKTAQFIEWTSSY